MNQSILTELARVLASIARLAEFVSDWGVILAVAVLVGTACQVIRVLQEWRR